MNDANLTLLFASGIGYLVTMLLVGFWFLNKRFRSFRNTLGRRPTIFSLALDAVFLALSFFAAYNLVLKPELSRYLPQQLSLESGAWIAAYFIILPIAAFLVPPLAEFARFLLRIMIVFLSATSIVIISVTHNELVIFGETIGYQLLRPVLAALFPFEIGLLVRKMKALYHDTEER